MPTSIHHTLPIRPLLERTADQTRRQLATIAGTEPRTLARWIRAGRIPIAAADRAACALGTHPGEIWPEWWDLPTFEAPADTAPCHELDPARPPERARGKLGHGMAARIAEHANSGGCSFNSAARALICEGLAARSEGVPLPVAPPGGPVDALDPPVGLNVRLDECTSLAVLGGILPALTDGASFMRHRFLLPHDWLTFHPVPLIAASVHVQTPHALRRYSTLRSHQHCCARRR